MKKTGSAHFILIVLAIVIGGAVLAGCGANTSSKSNLDRAKHLMSERDYAQAAVLLEKEHVAHPGDKATALLLAQAYLGNADIEMLELATKVMSAGIPAQASELNLSLSCPGDPIARLSDSDLGCVLYRTLLQLPSTENPDFLRAQALLRETFPDPKSSPIDVNFLSAFVEFSSSLGHIKSLASRNAPEAPNGTLSDSRFHFLIHHGKGAIDGLLQGFRRLRFSYGKLSKFVTSIDGRPLIQIGKRSLVFSDQIGVPEFLRFLAQVAHDGSREINSNLSGAAAELLRMAGPGLYDLISAVNDGFGDELGIMWQFESAINGFLNASALLSEGDLDLFSMMWANPPKLFQNLASALESAWDLEQMYPLREYFNRTAGQWRELESIINGWNRWVNSLDLETKSHLRLYMRDLKRRDPRFTDFPLHVTAETLHRWQSGVSAAAFDALDEVIAGKVDGIPQPSSEQAQAAKALIARTRAWMADNLWSF